MCGRYYIAQEDNDEEIARIIAELNKTPGVAAVQRGEILPSQVAPVILNTPQGWMVKPMRWGFQRPNGNGLVINSRSEKADVTPMFSRAVREGRCLVPMSGFYEWRHRENGVKSKEKYAFTLADGHAMFLAGICSHAEGCFSILTQAADEQMSPYHHRMPVILGSRLQRHGWLFSPGDTAYSALKSLFQPPALAVEPVRNCS